VIACVEHARVGRALCPAAIVRSAGDRPPPYRIIYKPPPCRIISTGRRHEASPAHTLFGLAVAAVAREVLAMTVLTMSALVWLASCVAGLVGSLTGLGGGVVIVPLLALGFHVDIHYAIGASLLSVIATSSGAAAAYVREGFSNIRVGMFLEIATTLGAIGGAWFALHISAGAVAIIFGVVLLASALLTLRSPHPATGQVRVPEGGLGARLRLGAEYVTSRGPTRYEPRRVPAGFAVMFLAGALSGVLGIGSGALKVIAMDEVMRLPFKVSTATSNFMIGVTAAASAGTYLSRGYVDPALTFPVVLGILPGSLLGARWLPRMHTSVLRGVFAAVIAVLAAEMFYNGVTARL
jgi:uncharacterized protein